MGGKYMHTIEVVKCWQNQKNGALMVVIPKAIREKLGFESGDRFLMTFDKQNRLILKKVDQTL